MDTASSNRPEPWTRLGVRIRLMLETVLGRLLDRYGGTVRTLANRLTLAAAVWLAVGLASSIFVVWAFAELTEEVIEGESRRFDRAVLLWIGENFPGWLDGPMSFFTALGYYQVVLPLLAVAVLGFYLLRWRLSAVVLMISTAGGVVLTTVLKAVFRRARPEILDTGYTASFYSFPSGHATVAVGFYGALTFMLSYHLRGAARWTVVVLGTALVLLIGLSRLYLGVHYPTDVLAGFLAAPLWLIFIGVVYVAWLSVRGLRAAESRPRNR